jgi:TolB-like protein
MYRIKKDKGLKFNMKHQHFFSLTKCGRKALWLFVVVHLLVLSVVGCVTNQEATEANKKGKFPLSTPQIYSGILESSYRAAENLGEELRYRDFGQDSPILVASFVNIDNLEQSSTLGRIISEQVASRLAQQGFKIIETKLRQGSIFVQKGKGEFLLSRDLLNLVSNQGARAVLVGTYAVSEYFVFVSSRVVRTEDSSVIAGYDYEIPQDKTTRSML